MGQLDMYVMDMVKRIQHNDLLIVGYETIDKDNNQILFADYFGEQLRFELTKCCLQRPEIFEKVKIVFTKLGRIIEDTEHEKAIMEYAKKNMN
jgi:hypothetical protein